MQALIHSARDHGLNLMEGVVLAENKGMLQLMAELGFKSKPSKEGRELVLVERWL